MITREEAIKKIIERLKLEPDIESKDIEIDSNTDPIFQLGKDSQFGVEFSLELEDCFEIEIPTNQNPFIDESGTHKRSRKISEIADFCLNIITSTAKEE